MATRSGGSGSKSGSRSGSGSRSKSGSRGTSKSRTGAKRASSARTASSGRTSGAGPGTDRADKSVEAFRDALERSVTLSRDRLRAVVDDAVKRGPRTRDDANELVSSLVTRSRRYTDDLVKQLERL